MPKKAKNLPSCELLHHLLDQRIEHPEKTKALDSKIKKSFEQTRTIFILDMSGFSKAVQRYGIIHFLAMIQRMRRIVKPVVARFDGVVIKFEADNCFAVFPNPEKALSASLQIHHDLEIANLMTDDMSDVHVSIGIGHGPVLLFCEDMYGNELNLASKLGEDVAERGEILLTSAARKLVKNKKFRFDKVPITISGVTMYAHRLSTSAS
ncbi:adenylate/guanylate cyclase domain-containing protein [Candidatus Uhrbacteria bacterium]|nr:adenylate/guanylate cyclase domain-containing protein [Candidatus Uhrbacteria bacterium]